jgi:hypothetical protein
MGRCGRQRTFTEDFIDQADHAMDVSKLPGSRDASGGGMAAPRAFSPRRHRGI